MTTIVRLSLTYIGLRKPEGYSRGPAWSIAHSTNDIGRLRWIGLGLGECDRLRLAEPGVQAGLSGDASLFGESGHDTAALGRSHLFLLAGSLPSYSFLSFAIN